MFPFHSQPRQVEFIRDSPLFAGLREESLGLLARASRFVTVDKGDFLFLQHDPADALYILCAGEMVVVLTSIDGREMIIDELKPGDCFGEVALLASGTRTAGAQAREVCEVLSIEAGAFLSVLDVEPHLARRMLTIATRRLFKSQQRESALAFLDAPARVARVLLEMDESDRLGPDKGYITLSQDELARRTGLSRQTVTGILSRWRKPNWIVTGRGRITLLNRAELQHVREFSLL